MMAARKDEAMSKLDPRLQARVTRMATAVAQETTAEIYEQSKLDQKIAKIQREAEDEIERVKAAAAVRVKQAEQRAIWEAKELQERTELRARLEEIYGTSGMVKAELLWAKAWEHGHANGAADVEYWYGEFAEFIS